jgi:glutamyl-Q tRNA(Asp) synthetase
MKTRPYRGRFAPSPTGPLHAGSLVAALASWLDARAHDGKWLIRIEDIDTPRERPGAAQAQLALLCALGMESDEPVLRQSERTEAYALALQQLQAAGLCYYCDCSRARRAALAEEGTDPGVLPAAYPGTCRNRAVGPPAALRFRVGPGEVAVLDRACGWYRQDVERAVGDPVIFRADGYWAYQLAVVVDDGHQGITDVVRGADLLDNTPRQILLQRALGLPQPRYLHVPLVRDAAGRKLSKQAGDAPLAADGAGAALALLEQAWAHLGFLPTGATRLDQFHARAVDAWRRRWALDGDEPAVGAAAPAGRPRGLRARETI